MDQTDPKIAALAASIALRDKRSRGGLSVAKVKELIAESTTGGSSQGALIFLDAMVTVQASTTSAVSWTTFNASAYLPSNAVFAVLQVTGGFANTTNARINARRDSSGVTYEIHRGRAGGASGDDTASTVQVFVPITTSRTFDYEITFGYTYDASIQLIGYVTSIGGGSGGGGVISVAHALLDGSVVNDSVASPPAKGSLVVGNSTPKWGAFALGTEGQVLLVATTAPFGLAWGTVAGGGGGGTVSAGTASVALGQVVFSNSNGVTFGLSGSTVTASHNGLTSQSNQALSAANGSFTFQTATFANSNGVSFSTGTQGIYASHNGITSQTNQTVGLYASSQTTNASSGTADARSLTFVGMGGMTVGYSNGSFVLSGAAGGGGAAGTQSFGMASSTAGGSTSGTTGSATGTALNIGLYAGSNVLLSQSLNAANASISIHAYRTADRFNNLASDKSLTRFGTSHGTFVVIPIANERDNAIPFSMTASRFGIMLFGSNTATASSSGAFTHTYKFGIYQETGVSLSLINSVSSTFTGAANASNTSLYHGSRWLTINGTQWSATLSFVQGNRYYLGYQILTSGQAHAVSFVGAQLGTTGQISGFMYTSTATATSMGLGWNPGGMYSVSFSTALPTIIQWNLGPSAFNRAVVAAHQVPYLKMDTLTNNGDWLVH